MRAGRGWRAFRSRTVAADQRVEAAPVRLSLRRERGQPFRWHRKTRGGPTLIAATAFIPSELELLAIAALRSGPADHQQRLPAFHPSNR